MTTVCVLSHRWLRLLTATRHAESDPQWTAALTTFAGLLLGVFVTLSSVGAGAIGMTALVLLYPRTPIARLVGSDIAHAVPLTLIAGVGHWLLGSVDWVLLGSLVMGSLPGIFFGGHLRGGRCTVRLCALDRVRDYRTFCAGIGGAMQSSFATTSVVRLIQKCSPPWSRISDI